MSNKKNLAKIVLATVVAMNVCGSVFAAQNSNDDSDNLTNTRGRVQHVEYTTKTDTSGLKDPNINHPTLSHDSACGEYVHDTDITIGDLNKVVDDLVANDKKLDSDIKAEAKTRESADTALSQKISAEETARKNEDKIIDTKVNREIEARQEEDSILANKIENEKVARANGDIVSGQINGDTLQLVKGDNSTIDIDVSDLGGIKNDTYVTDASYDGDSQTITIERNNNQPDISIQLDNVAKADDLDGLTSRVETNETNIASNTTRIEVVEGDTISAGSFANNTITLEKNNGNDIVLNGIASTGDINNNKTKIENNTIEIEKNKEAINKETEQREREDARLDDRIDGVSQDISDLNGRYNRLDGKINKTGALAIAHASLKPLDYDPEYQVTGALGVGNYHGENAIAAGLFYQPNKDLMLNFSISACGSEKGIGGGVSVRFK